ncbi:MAG: hypothetical protein JSW40_03480, partial [Candidatus Omnitrophota bacterium]
MNKIFVFSAISMLFVAGCITLYNPATQRKEIYFIDEATEVSIGRNMASEIVSSNRLAQDVALTHKVERI